MQSVQNALLTGINFLKNENITSYNIDAKLLLMKVLHLNKVELLTSTQTISENDLAEYKVLLKKRAEKMPVAYITGNIEFMSLQFKICENVLIPRGDTEILVEKAIEEIKLNDYKFLLDIGCGSGCIPISIAHYTNISSISADIDDIPLKLAEKNAILNNVLDKISFIKSDLFENIDESLKFDIITSNPPYITTNEMNTLMDDVVKYEPHLALHGGKDGLDFYKKIAPIAFQRLNNNGTIIFEIGLKQGMDVKILLENCGFSKIEILKDLQNLDRVVLGKK